MGKYCRHKWVVYDDERNQMPDWVESVVCVKCAKTKRRKGRGWVELEEDSRKIMFGCGYGTINRRTK